MQAVFDIETGPLPETELATLAPLFDPAEVKMGNLKDSAKISARLAEAEANQRREFLENAALDPLTGRVLAVGLLYPDSGEYVVIGHDDEAHLLQEFWGRCKWEMGRVNQLIGFNVTLFDLPFVFRRSWKHGLPIPFGFRRGRYWSDQVVDLRDVWQLGDRHARGSLASIAQHLGLGCKTDSGKSFAALWEADRSKAVAYLRNDLELTAKMAKALGVLG